MSSLAHGQSTSDVEVTHISAHGIWLLARGKEYFLSFEDFPWFKERPVREVLNVEEQGPGHFYWPDIDVDLSEKIIDHPDRYPLKSPTA